MSQVGAIAISLLDFVRCLWRICGDEVLAEALLGSACFIQIFEPRTIFEREPRYNVLVLTLEARYSRVGRFLRRVLFFGFMLLGMILFGDSVKILGM